MQPKEALTMLNTGMRIAQRLNHRRNVSEEPNAHRARLVSEFMVMSRHSLALKSRSALEFSVSAREN